MLQQQAHQPCEGVQQDEDAEEPPGSTETELFTGLIPDSIVYSLEEDRTDSIRNIENNQSCTVCRFDWSNSSTAFTEDETHACFSIDPSFAALQPASEHKRRVSRRFSKLRQKQEQVLIYNRKI